MIIKSKLADTLFLVLISFAVFYESLDIYFVSENISHIETALNDFLSLVYTNNYFRPLYVISLFLDRITWGLNSSGYHFTNLLIHTLNALLVYYLTIRVLQIRFFALIAAFLFLLHPIHSLSIFWISGRTDLICSLFYLSALILFDNYFTRRNSIFYLLSILTFLLAMLSKEMAVSLPFLIIAYVLIFSESKPKERFRESLWLSSGYLLVLLLVTLFRFFAISNNVFSSKDHINISSLQLLKNFSAYLGLLIIPGGHIEIANYLKAHPVVFIILAGGGLLVSAILLFWIRKSKILLFFCLFLLLTLLPVTRLLMRWYLYIPSIGFCLALAFVLYRLHISKIGKWNIAYLVSVLIVFVYAFFIMEEQNRWVDAGQISKKISYQVARKISQHNIDRCFFLNVPGELEEVPVMMYGISSFINFRLRNDFNDPREVQIFPVCSMSLSQSDDLNRVIVGKMGNRNYLISLEQSGSFFVFPYHRQITTKRVKIEEGLELEDSGYKLRIEKINDRNEANKVIAEILKPGLPVLYYLNGEIYLDGDGGNDE